MCRVFSCVVGRGCLLWPVHSKGDQSLVFIGRTDAKAETPILGHLMQRVDSLEKTLMLGGIGGRRRRRQQRMRWLMVSLTRWTWVWVNSGSYWWTGRPGVLRFMGLQRVGHDWATELNWRNLKLYRWLLHISSRHHRSKEIHSLFLGTRYNPLQHFSTLSESSRV